MKPIERKTKRQLEAERMLGEPLEEALRRMYVDEDQSVMSIASVLGVTYLIAHRWIKQAGIYSRRLRV